MGSNIKNRQRAFGQNFLVDDKVISDILSDITTNPSDWIIEIGPGAGRLTKNLLAKTNYVTAIEADALLFQKLKSKKGFEGLTCIHGDGSKITLQELFDPRSGIEPKSKPILVGNLPYNMSTAILKNFLPDISKFQYMYFMFQYEVAKRLVANPGNRNFGSLSVYTQNFSKAELKLKISPEAFRPKPNIFSATVRFESLISPFSTSPFFFQFVEDAFKLKRKKLTNSLNGVYPKKLILEALESEKLSTNTRAEELSVTQFLKLFQFLIKD